MSWKAPKLAEVAAGALLPSDVPATESKHPAKPGRPVFRRILVPIDLADAETAKKTLATASNIAFLTGANLRLVYVRYMIENVMQYMPAKALETDEEAALTKLSELGDATGLPKDQISVVSPCGRAYAEILAAASNFGADLIVIGPHSPSMSKFLLGTDAGRILRHAPMSVLVAR